MPTPSRAGRPVGDPSREPASPRWSSFGTGSGSSAPTRGSLAALEDAAEADYVLAYTLGTEPGASQSRCPPACLLGAQAFIRLLAGLAVHRPAAHRASSSQAAPTRRGPVAPGSRLDPGGADRASSQHLRMVAEQSLSDRRLGRGEGDAASPQRLLLAVVEPEQRGDGLAERAGAARGATTRPVRDLVTIVDGRPFAGGGSRSTRATRSRFAASSAPRSAPTPARPPT